MLRSLIFIFVILFSQYSIAFSYTLEITEKELQEKLSIIMPLEKKKYFVKIKITEPKVDLIIDSNEIGVMANIEATIPGGLKGRGVIEVKGSIKYERIEGAFYLKDAEIVSLDIEKISKKYIPTIKKITQATVTKALAKYPVYKFKDDNVKHELAKATLKSVGVKNEILLVTLSFFQE